jgi:hypothetical protein
MEGSVTPNLTFETLETLFYPKGSLSQCATLIIKSVY